MEVVDGNLRKSHHIAVELTGFWTLSFLHFVTNFAAEPEHELFLVYGKGRPGVIRGMDMNAKVPDEYMIPIENLMNPRALDFHAESEFIYFADATSYIIGRQKIDGTERDTILKEGSLICTLDMFEMYSNSFTMLFNSKYHLPLYLYHLLFCK